MNALELGIPLTLIGESVFARCLSAQKDERVRASVRLPKSKQAFTGDKSAMIDAIRDALYASKIISYPQGFRLMSRASSDYGWGLEPGTIASIWRAGCIIRAEFLEDITAAYEGPTPPTDLSLHEFFAAALKEAEPSWRRVVAGAVSAGIPVPAYASALTYFDGMRSRRLPANLIQAQRDFFGAHTFERTDRPRGEFFHHNW